MTALHPVQSQPHLHREPRRETPESGPIYHNTQQALSAFDLESREARAQAHRYDTQSVQLANAVVLIQHGEMALAKHLLRALLEADSYCLDAIRLLAQVLKDQGEIENAERCLLTWTHLDPSEVSFFELGSAYYLQAKDNEALEAFRRSLDLIAHESPRLFEIYKNLGNIFVRAGDFEAAEEHYNKAYTLNPESDVLMVNYGTLEVQRGHYADAVSRFRTAIDYCRTNDRAWVGLSLVHRELGDIALAWANLEYALDLNPLNETALRLAVDWSLKDLCVDRAIGRLRSYLDVKGDQASIALWLAQLLFIVGHLDEAAFEIERALALEPLLEGAEKLASAIHKAVKERSAR